MSTTVTAHGRTRGLSAVAALCGLLVIALLWLRPDADTDVWLHLSLGRFLDGAGRFGLPDPFVVTADHPYVPTQWLAEMAGWRLWQLGGMPAIQLLRLVVVLALVMAVLAACRQVAGPVPAALGTAFAVFATAAGWAERPQLAGLLFVAVTWAAWLRAERSGRPPWLLVPLTWLWAGIHGTWVIGIGLGALACLGGALDAPTTLRRRLPQLLVPLLSAGAVALTPLGPRLLLAPFAVTEAVRDHVSEWGRPTLDNPLFVALLLAGGVILWSWWRTRTWRPGRVVVLLAGLVVGASMVRLVAVGAIIIAPLLAEALTRRAGPAHEPSRPVERRIWAAVALVVLLVGSARATASPPGAPVAPEVSAALGQVAPHTVAVVDPALTGWVLYAHPQLRLVRDLRTEIYSATTLEAVDDLLNARGAWVATTQRYRIGAALLEDRSPLGPALARELGWVAAARGDGQTLWLPAQPARS